MKHARRVVVIHPGALGDLVIAAYAVRAVRDVFPEAIIDAYTRGNVWSIFGVVDNWTELELSGIHKLYESAEPDVIGRADIAICWMGKKNDGFLDNLRESTGAQIIADSPNPPEGVSALEHLINSLDRLGIDLPRPGLKVDIDHKFTEKTRNLLKKAGVGDISKTMLVAPGSGSIKKCWSAARFAELIEWRRSSGKEAALLVGPADEKIFGEITTITGVIPVINTPPLEILADILEKCEIYVGNDSGVTHLSAAVGARTVAIFASTDPAVWGPAGERVHIIDGGADRSPRTAEKRGDCENPHCFDNITAGMVIKTIENALNSG